MASATHGTIDRPLKTLGLLGGMSWESTVLYYRIINEHVRNRMGSLHSAPLILHSFDFYVIEALQAAGDWIELSRLLANAAYRLKQAGAEAIVICTNTMHKVVQPVETLSHLPVLHIADMTGQRIAAAGHSRVGLLATRYTMEQDFYKSRLEERYGVQVIVPDQQGRDEVHRIIYEELCNGIVREESRRRYVEIADDLVEQQGIDCLIMGCTEITMLISQTDVQVPVFDTTMIHAQGAAEWAISSSPHSNGVGIDS